MNILEKSIKHFEGLQKRYTTQHNGKMCEMVDCALKTMNKAKWIPVSERLPEEHEEYQDVFDPDTLAVTDTEWYVASDLVLVTVRDYEKDTLFVCDDITVDGKWVNYNGDDFEVIAWKPMPEEYKGE